ncbi:HK97-gp10 family putative phage morphogenesis protein [Shewanella xiamenensis]|uniref:HK97-gp10 family putative phage morphogenesis protein n=1 Tax=Shewanella xiamenensis TaxID=332186 RepID=UPI00313E7D73
MAVIKFELIGLKEVRKKMAKVTRTILDDGTRHALSQAAELVKKAAQENALKIDDPKTGRRIRDNIILQFGSRKFLRDGLIMYRIGVTTPRGRIPTPNEDEGSKGSTPHWHLVELGTERSQAKPFMRPALANNINPVIDKVITELEKELDKALSE